VVPPSDTIRLGIIGIGMQGQGLLRGGARAIASYTRSYSLRRHLYPEPRLTLGTWLAACGLVSAAMDVSDGLSTDLARLCAASRVGAVVHSNALPLASDARLRSRSAESPRERASQLRRTLHGGEDYELLFTVPHARVSRLPANFHGIPLTRIGEIVRGRSVLLLDAAGRLAPLQPLGWDHFASP
jgi:thiamine-monophosphate kinase